MEHIVQFAIGIDDEAIKKRVQESGYNDIVKTLSNDIKVDFRSKGYCNQYNGEIKWDDFAANMMRGFFEEHKDEIIDAAADKLCDYVKRAKAFKEKMGKVE